MIHEITPGLVRVSGTGDPLLVGSDCRVEAQLGDGRWLLLRGVTLVDIKIRPDAFVLATVEIELGVVDLTGVVPDQIVWRDRRSRWARLVSWVRGR